MVAIAILFFSYWVKVLLREQRRSCGFVCQIDKKSTRPVLTAF